MLCHLWVHPRRQGLAAQASDQVLGRDLGHARPGRDAGAGDVRHDDTVGQAQQRTVHVDRLRFGDVEIISGSESGIDVFRRISDPIGFKKELFDQKESLGRLDVFEGRAERVLSAEAPSAGDVPELIAELDELRQKGVITDVEFEEKKRQLLTRI